MQSLLDASPSVLGRSSQADSAGGLVIDGGIRDVVVVGTDSCVDQTHEVSNGVVTSSSVSGGLGQRHSGVMGVLRLKDVVPFVRDRHVLRRDK